MSSKIGRLAAKLLGIELIPSDPTPTSHKPGARDAYEHVDYYLEPEPTLGDWVREHTPSGRTVRHCFYHMFPFWQWIWSYNMQWFIGDMIAGITVGAVVIPQGMAYAILAKLPAEYGLYSSFMGVLIYWFFATSKDITIGPVAVMSTLVGTIIIDTQEKYPDIEATTIAGALGIVCGAIVTFLGLTRLGFIVDFIPLPAITAFMTGSAINVCAGQIKTVLGETASFSTRGATYKVIIDTLRYLPTSQMDAAMGLTALAMLYGIRSACNYGSRKYPHKAKVFFFLSTLRTVFVILFYTMVSAAVNLHRRHNPAFKLLGKVPYGFQHAGVPKISVDIIRTFAHELPAAVIVLVIEHIAISKSFGRVNNYTIDPSQEFIAIGIANLLGPFLGGYPATGSFSRTAIKAKAGVRTPLAGVITAVVVLLAIYALSALFFFIPSSSLSAVIVHAVGDLIAPPSTIYRFWQVAPLDAIICLVGIVVIIFSTIEIGIYCTICMSLAVLLFRIAKARGQFLGQVQIHSVIGDHLLDDSSTIDLTKNDYTQSAPRSLYLPVSHADGSNPAIQLVQPTPGVIIYRLSDGFNYPNANHYTDHLVQHIFDHTRRTDPASYAKPGDRPWNDPGPRARRNAETSTMEDSSVSQPVLRAIILDFAAVNSVDISVIQNLIDVRNQLDRYAAPNLVQWHFAHVNNKWTKRALVAAGFERPLPSESPQGMVVDLAEWDEGPMDGTALRPSDAESQASGKGWIDKQGMRTTTKPTQAALDESDLSSDIEHAITTTHPVPHTGGTVFDSPRRRIAMVSGVNMPHFHADLTGALAAVNKSLEGGVGVSPKL
ncbi:SLC26/SulP family anion transporter [Aspergillus brunneoviolaceus CBS 621.78]|uniref:Sulfate permease SutA-penicillium chrysogenum n=1 Tax=Aspergillus brunneoviolaceus CBS 621.78 TaxID=1450534 RepID=A0ACD1GDX5_9EURO|nr:sulfate permease SutA-penicillium chrysogenum [Aspergillus brunneoviolaceus CBS 621.78]RAH47489.1 sulfate permease SutA-penicillium chrysogenum [Aspergillus brunneoviolaceus CBS 621.78]